MPDVEIEANRMEPVKRRIALAKTALIVGAAATFGGALALTRQHIPSHPKSRLRPLRVAPSYASDVRKHLGSGAISPPQSSPSAATHVS